jgi:hypothetical protein
MGLKCRRGNKVYTWTVASNLPALSQNTDGRLKIVCGDFFALTPEVLGGTVDCVWDRGSFVAIDVVQREKYFLYFYILYFCRDKSKPGINVMIYIFCDFRPFPAVFGDFRRKNWRFIDNL